MDVSYHRAKSNKMIVLLHGLMGSKDAPYRTEFAQRMNKLNYNVVRVNFSKGGGQNICHEDIFSSQLGDLEMVCRDLSDYDLGLMGACTGGNVALAHSSMNKKIKCVFTLAPFSIPLDYGPENFVKFDYILPEELSEQYNSYRRAINNIASEKKRGKILKKIKLFLSPGAIEDFLKYDLNSLVSKISEDVPISFVVGDRDPLVSPKLTLPLYGAKKGIKDLKIIKSKTHGYILPHEAQEVNRLAEEFFIKYL